MHLKSVMPALALVSLLSGVAHASVLDQSNPAGPAALNGSDIHWQQQVTDGISGKLVGIVLYASWQGPDIATVSLGMGAPAFGRSFDFTSTPEMLAASGTYFDVSAANYLLDAGDIFTIEVGGGTLHCCRVAAATGPYSGGHLYEFGSEDVSDEYGLYLAFQTYIETLPPPEVPEPATLFLMGAALAGVGFARKRKA